MSSSAARSVVSRGLRLTFPDPESRGLAVTVHWGVPVLFAIAAVVVTVVTPISIYQAVCVAALVHSFVGRMALRWYEELRDEAWRASCGADPQVTPRRSHRS
jgi:hypothetical protein